MIAVPQFDAAGNQTGIGWRLTPEEEAALPPAPDPVDVPPTLEERIAALEAVATGDAPDLATARQAQISARSGVATLSRSASSKVVP